MNWGRSYSSTWRVFKVNKDTWADGEALAGVDSVSVTRTADGSLLESGSIELTGDIEPGYYRVVMTADQGGYLARVEVATLLFISNGGGFDYGTHTHKADGYSVLYPASVTTVITGGYAPAEINGAEYAGNLLAGAINAPVKVDGNFTLNEPIVHAVGSSVLEAAWAVLDAGGFVIQLDGHGTVHIRPRPTEPDLVIDNQSAGLMLNGTSFKADESGIPNRYIVIQDAALTLAENSDPVSTVSTLTRGYTVDVTDTSPTPIDGETMAEYAGRRLHELSVLKEEQTYTREYAPGVDLYSIVRATLDAFEGDYRVTSQTVNCGNGITVAETVEKETSLW